MLPAHVGGLDDALFYLREWVDRLGAITRTVEEPVTGALYRGRLVAVELRPVELRFADGRRLNCRARLGASLEPVFYTFNCMESSGHHLWAYHFHPGHEELGQLSHAHLTPGDAGPVTAYPPVDVEFVAEQLHQ